jgi:NRPS condensation-like uncharacterized protein
LYRKMLFFERLMYVDGQTPVNCVIAARICGELSLESLQLALDKVQAKHQLLGATVTERDGAPGFTLTEKSPRIPCRVVERTGEDDWKAELLKEWKTPFGLEHEPPIRLAWIRSRDISEVLLVAHHCVCDGASLVTVFRELLLATDQPDLPLKPYRSFQSLEELLPDEIFNDFKLAAMIFAKSALFRLFSCTIRPAERIPNGEHYQICWKADSDTAGALSLRSKSEDTTPFAAMSVAFLMAFRMCRGANFKNKMMCPINIRRYIPGIAEDAVFNYAPTVALALDRNPKMGFWTLAKMLKRSLSQKVDRLNAYEHLMAAEHLHSANGKLIQLLLRSEGSYDFAFSNVGRLNVEQTYSSFQLTRILGITVALPWRNATTLISTQFKGEIDLSFVSRDDFMPLAEALQIKDQAIEILTRSLA